MNNYKLQEGLNALDRIKLLMEYDMSKTLTENELLTEQKKQGGYIDGSFYELNNPPPGYVWNPQKKETRQELDKNGKIRYRDYIVGGFEPLTYENINLRGVPWGFEPTEYPDYMKKVREIYKKYDEQSKRKFTSWQQNPTDAPMGNTIERQKGIDTVGQRQKELDELRKEYYHFDFPYGIKKEDYKLWSESKKLRLKEKQQEYAKTKKFYESGSRQIVPGSDYFATLNSKQKQDIVVNQLSNVSKKYQTIEDYLNVIFEHDPTALAEISKSGLQKWWEKWRDLIEFVGWIVVDVASEGMAIAAEGRQAYLLAKLIRKGVQVGLPLAIGSAIMIEEGGLSSESIMYFCFAVLPFAHAAFGLKQKPTVELCESILGKMKGVNLKNPKELKLFVSKLTQSEKSIFRKVALFDKNTIENGSKWAIQNISINASRKIDNINNLIKHYGLKTIKPNMLVKGGKFIGRLSADLTAINLVTEIFSKLGLTWKEEKKQELISYFDNLLKSKEDPSYKLMIVLNTISLLSENPDSELSQIILNSKKETIEDMSKSDIEITTKSLNRISDNDMEDLIMSDPESEK